MRAFCAIRRDRRYENARGEGTTDPLSGVLDLRVMGIHASSDTVVAAVAAPPRHFEALDVEAVG